MPILMSHVRSLKTFEIFAMACVDPLLFKITFFLIDRYNYDYGQDTISKCAGDQCSLSLCLRRSAYSV